MCREGWISKNRNPLLNTNVSNLNEFGQILDLKTRNPPFFLFLSRDLDQTLKQQEEFDAKLEADLNKKSAEAAMHFINDNIEVAPAVEEDGTIKV